MAQTSIAHIAIAVKDIEKSSELYKTLLGADVGEVIDVPDQKVRVCFFDLPDGRLELISPMGDNKSLLKFLEKRGEGLHHIALAVPNIEEALREFKKKGVRLIDETPRIGAEGHRIAFVHPSSTGGVLIELEESAD